MGRGVPWEGTAYQRTQRTCLKTGKVETRRELPVHLDVWPRSWPALEPWNSGSSETALGEHHNLWFSDCVLRNPRGQGKLNSCAVPSKWVVLSKDTRIIPGKVTLVFYVIV